ncbi:MAG TPA: redoxin domain-containing protein, partial [Bacteroidales bacterium]|nr:redoxin domain-containing protein [Bacteroidales bacterium]
EFFNTFFDGYFNDIAGKIDEVELVSAVNKQKSYIALFNALGKDSLLKNERLRELVMLVTLRNMYYTQGYDRKAVENILHELSEISKFKQHKTIALNLIKKIDKFKKGSPAPYFKLKDKNEQFVSLNDFKGKYIYLTFWNTQCVDCEAEFELINNVYNKIKAKTEVVSISTDKHFLTMQLFLKKKKYLWTFLHFNGDYQLLENYQVKTVPFYILIGPEGEIIDYPAKSPIYNLENYLNKNISTKN